jgi:hypothetical protein
MRPIINIFKLLIAGLILLTGCAGRLHKASVEKDRRTTAEGRFDPLGFPGDDAVITGQGKSSKMPVQAEHDLSMPDNSDQFSSPSGNQPDTETASATVIFRVQVFASKSFDEAQQFASDIEQLFPEGVFVEYQTPYYKVRVGEFYDPDEGEAFLDFVKQLGFKNAWLVRVFE